MVVFNFKYDLVMEKRVGEEAQNLQFFSMFCSAVKYESQLLFIPCPHHNDVISEVFIKFRYDYRDLTRALVSFMLEGVVDLQIIFSDCTWNLVLSGIVPHKL